MNSSLTGLSPGRAGLCPVLFLNLVYLLFSVSGFLVGLRQNYLVRVRQKALKANISCVQTGYMALIALFFKKSIEENSNVYDH